MTTASQTARSATSTAATYLFVRVQRREVELRALARRLQREGLLEGRVRVPLLRRRQAAQHASSAGRRQRDAGQAPSDRVTPRAWAVRRPRTRVRSVAVWLSGCGAAMMSRLYMRACASSASVDSPVSGGPASFPPGASVVRCPQPVGAVAALPLCR
jgi:hypothetical protein